MKSCMRSCLVASLPGSQLLGNRATWQPDNQTKSPTPESTWGQIEERIRTCRLFSFFYPGCKRPQINPARGECRPRKSICQTTSRRCFLASRMEVDDDILSSCARSSVAALAATQKVARGASAFCEHLWS